MLDNLKNTRREKNDIWARTIFIKFSKDINNAMRLYFFNAAVIWGISM